VPRSQLKLTAALAGLVALVLAVAGGKAERDLREGAIRRIERSLEDRADLVREIVRGVPLDSASAGRLARLAERLAQAGGARVTLMAPDGTVVADSDVALARIPDVASHADRPEVRAALAGRVGRAVRRSATVGRELYYVAIPVEGGEGGAVRLAVDLSDVEAAVWDLRLSLLAGGAVGLAAAMVLGYALAWYSMRPVERLRRAASRLARGEPAHRLPIGAGDPLAPVADAINQVGDQLRLRLEQVTLEKNQLQAVIDSMVEGVLVVDAKGAILLANTRLRELYDVWGELLGRTPLQAIRNAEMDALLRDAAGTDEPVSREMGTGPPRGAILHGHAIRFPAGHGPRAGTVAVFHDVTELHRLEKVRRDFVANASHELRTPLAAIRGYAERLLEERGRSAAEQRTHAEVIDRHARRLQALVDDLLELSRIESRETSLQLSPVEVADLAATLVRDSRARFDAKSLDVRVRQVGSPKAWADPRAVEQIVTNLLDNAAKYTEAGGRIDVEVEGTATSVRIAVSDTGIGIPQEDRDRIFERFYRVDKARSRALGGTGLGLAIVKHLVQRLGGQVAVRSDPGRGSRFTVTLPAAPAAGGETGDA